MASELSDIRKELDEMNIHLEDIRSSLAVIATAVDRGLVDIVSAIRYAGKD